TEPKAEEEEAGDADAGEAEAAAPGREAEEAAGRDAEQPAGSDVQIVMPEMGESVTEGTILEWHVSEGDQVEEGQTVVEVSTDKVDAEVPAPTSGTITKILVQPDEEVDVGAPLAEMAPGDAESGNGGDPSAAGASGEAAEQA